MKQRNKFGKNVTKMADYYADVANVTSRDANEAQNRLSEILVTAALAFIAIVAATIEKQESTGLFYSFILMSALALFILSIFFGITNCFILKKYFNKMSKTAGIVVHQLDAAEKEEDIEITKKTWLQVLKGQSEKDSPQWAIYMQTGCFIIAIILLLICIGTILF